MITVLRQYWLSLIFMFFLQWKNFGLALLFVILQILSFTWWVTVPPHGFQSEIIIRSWHIMFFVYRYSLSYIPFVRFVIYSHQLQKCSESKHHSYSVLMSDLCELLPRDAIFKLVAVCMKWVVSLCRGLRLDEVFFKGAGLLLKLLKQPPPPRESGTLTVLSPNMFLFHVYASFIELIHAWYVLIIYTNFNEFGLGLQYV